MEIIPIEYCDLSDDYIHLNQSHANCAFDHNCGESEFNNCPLKPFFSISNTGRKKSSKDKQSISMPSFYLLDE